MSGIETGSVGHLASLRDDGSQLVKLYLLVWLVLWLVLRFGFDFSNGQSMLYSMVPVVIFGVSTASILSRKRKKKLEAIRKEQLADLRSSEDALNEETNSD